MKCWLACLALSLALVWQSVSAASFKAERDEARATIAAIEQVSVNRKQAMDEAVERLRYLEKERATKHKKNVTYLKGICDHEPVDDCIARAIRGE